MHGCPFRIAAIASLLAALACENAGTDRVLAIEATGTLTAIAYIDLNADENPDPTDAPAAGVRIGLLIPGTRDTAAVATTGDNGLAFVTAIPVGHYSVMLDSTTVPDSLEVVGLDSAAVTIAANDSLIVVVTLRRDGPVASAPPTTATPRWHAVVHQQHPLSHTTSTVALPRHLRSGQSLPLREIRQPLPVARVVHHRGTPVMKPAAVQPRSARLRPTKV
ncbi:MAG TPA: hypothetical protein VF188_11315 [Longimicrobiales bacterium]